MVNSNSLTVLNNNNQENPVAIDVQNPFEPTRYRYMVVPKPYLTHVELEQSPEAVAERLQKILPSAHFDNDDFSHDFNIFFETEHPLTEEEIQTTTSSISTLKENKRTNFHYLTLKDAIARTCINLKRFEDDLYDIIHASIPGVCTYSVSVGARYFCFQSTELLSKRHLRSLEKQLMKRIPMFRRIFWQNFDDLFVRLSARAVARILESKTAIYAEYDKDIESDFLIKPVL